MGYIAGVREDPLCSAVEIELHLMRHHFAPDREIVQHTRFLLLARCTGAFCLLSSEGTFRSYESHQSAALARQFA